MNTVTFEKCRGWPKSSSLCSGCIIQRWSLTWKEQGSP